VSPELENLKAETKLEEKVRLWWEVCSNGDPTTLFSSQAWCHLQELRAKRNAILHALDPISVYSIKEMQVLLNRVRTGLGEVLLVLRKAHNKPTLGFIERLRSAPRVAFQEIDFRSDGPCRGKLIAG
jgi:hypothetical protein